MKGEELICVHFQENNLYIFQKCTKQQAATGLSKRKKSMLDDVEKKTNKVKNVADFIDDMCANVMNNGTMCT